MRAHVYNIRSFIKEIMYTGYMRVAVPNCWDEGYAANDIDKLIRVYSIATNYYPWVEVDRLVEIEKLLGPVLGEPRWFVDADRTWWNYEEWFDIDDFPISYVTTPYKYYIATRALRRGEGPRHVPPFRPNAK